MNGKCFTLSPGRRDRNLSPSFPSSPSSNPVACRPGPDRRRLSSLRPPRLGKRDGAYPADHASRHSDRGCRRLDATTGSTQDIHQDAREQRTRRSISEGTRNHRRLSLHIPLSFPHPLSLFSNLTHHPPCLCNGPQTPRGIGPGPFPFWDRMDKSPAALPPSIPASSSPACPFSHPCPDIHTQSQAY